MINIHCAYGTKSFFWIITEIDIKQPYRFARVFHVRWNLLIMMSACIQ